MQNIYLILINNFVNVALLNLTITCDFQENYEVFFIFICNYLSSNENFQHLFIYQYISIFNNINIKIYFNLLTLLQFF